jgi:hypothetical protein
VRGPRYRGDAAAFEGQDDLRRNAYASRMADDSHGGCERDSSEATRRDAGLRELLKSQIEPAGRGPTQVGATRLGKIRSSPGWLQAAFRPSCSFLAISPSSTVLGWARTADDRARIARGIRLLPRRRLVDGRPPGEDGKLAAT